MADRVLIVVSGVRTHAFFALRGALNEMGTPLIPITYGYVNALTAIFGHGLDLLAPTCIRHVLADAAMSYPDATMSIVASGFGGLIVARVLEDSSPDFTNRVRSVILCGPIFFVSRIRTLTASAALSSKFRILTTATWQRLGTNLVRGIGSALELYPPPRQHVIDSDVSLPTGFESGPLIGQRLAMGPSQASLHDLEILITKVTPQLDKLSMSRGATLPGRKGQLQLVAEGLRAALGFSPEALPLALAPA